MVVLVRGKEGRHCCEPEAGLPGRLFATQTCLWLFGATVELFAALSVEIHGKRYTLESKNYPVKYKISSPYTRIDRILFDDGFMTWYSEDGKGRYKSTTVSI